MRKPYHPVTKKRSGSINFAIVFYKSIVDLEFFHKVNNLDNNFWVCSDKFKKNATTNICEEQKATKCCNYVKKLDSVKTIQCKSWITLSC